MIRFQQDQENMAALLEMMLATNQAADPRARLHQALDWLMDRVGVVSGGVWLSQSGDLVCLAQRNLDTDDVAPQISQVLAVAAPAPLTHVYQSDLLLTVLPLGSANAQSGALAVVTQAPLDPNELLLLRAVAAHLASVIAQPQPAPSAGKEASDRLWEEFLGHAAHEIKNPLASIKGYADLMLRRAAKDPADPYRKGLVTISQQVGRTTALLDQLSDITRLAAGPLSLDRHEADLSAIVEQVVQEYQAADSQHPIALDSAHTALVGRFDWARMSQVVGAIISNALKFSFDGGAVSVLLQRSVADNGSALARLAVSDTGIGIPIDEQERVFERFFRGSNTRGMYAGLGVGLYVTRAIVDLHGGRIWVQSERGVGTICNVMLPLAA